MARKLPPATAGKKPLKKPDGMGLWGKDSIVPTG